LCPASRMVTSIVCQRNGHLNFMYMNMQAYMLTPRNSQNRMHT
jgi:hypothetical protein